MTSHLTRSSGASRSGIIEALEDEGYGFDSMHVSWPEFLASVLSDLTGQTKSHLLMSESELMAGLVTEYGNSVSNRTTSEAELLADLYEEVGASAPAGFSFLILDNERLTLNDSYLVMED